MLEQVLSLVKKNWIFYILVTKREVEIKGRIGIWIIPDAFKKFVAMILIKSRFTFRPISLEVHRQKAQAR
jgi:hypothetical protein